jgi:hypothetical protein
LGSLPFQEFERQYNEQWLIERDGYQSAAQILRPFTAPISAVG